MVMSSQRTGKLTVFGRMRISVETKPKRESLTN